MEREKMITKIRKLMAVANDKGATEAEAVQAALQAQKLIAKYGIDENDLNEAAEKEAEKVVTNETERRFKKPWQRDLAAVVAENFRCKMFYRGESRHGWAACFMGYESDAKAAELTFQMLLKVCTRKGNAYAKERMKYIEAHLDRWDYNYYYDEEIGAYRATPTKTQIINSYSKGFINGVRLELEKQCEALMLVCPAEVNEAYNKKVFSKARWRGGKGAGFDDFTAGQADGANAVTSHRMNGQKALNAA